MKQLSAIAAFLVLVAGCTTTEGAPTVEPQKLDCDLIFPAPSINP